MINFIKSANCKFQITRFQFGNKNEIRPKVRKMANFKYKRSKIRVRLDGTVTFHMIFSLKEKKQRRDLFKSAKDCMIIWNVTYMKCNHYMKCTIIWKVTYMKSNYMKCDYMKCNYMKNNYMKNIIWNVTVPLELLILMNLCYYLKLFLHI